jgi:hypothetical protein
VLIDAISREVAARLQLRLVCPQCTAICTFQVHPRLLGLQPDQLRSDDVDWNDTDCFSMFVDNVDRTIAPGKLEACLA